jgi:hypothetical protein
MGCSDLCETRIERRFPFEQEIQIGSERWLRERTRRPGLDLKPFLYLTFLGGCKPLSFPIGQAGACAYVSSPMRRSRGIRNNDDEHKGTNKVWATRYGRGISKVETCGLAVSNRRAGARNEG